MYIENLLRVARRFGKHYDTDVPWPCTLAPAMWLQSQRGCHHLTRQLHGHHQPQSSSWASCVLSWRLSSHLKRVWIMWLPRADPAGSRPHQEQPLPQPWCTPSRRQELKSGLAMPSSGKNCSKAWLFVTVVSFGRRKFDAARPRASRSAQTNLFTRFFCCRSTQMLGILHNYTDITQGWGTLQWAWKNICELKSHVCAQ